MFLSLEKEKPQVTVGCVGAVRDIVFKDQVWQQKR